MHRFTSQSAVRLAVSGACAAAIVFLSGCAGLSGTALPSGSISTPVFKASLHGGIQPIEGAHLYVMAANLTGGYGQASQSLITGGDGTDSIGSYVLTDANGAASYSGTGVCPTPNSQIYLLAIGGNPTGHQGGPQNQAIALSAAIGSCSTINASTFTDINEVTTVAMTFAMNQFMTGPTDVGASPGAYQALINAFTTAANLADAPTGTALAMTPGGNGVAPQRYVNTLANIIASCVNSGAATDSTCAQLFAYANSSTTTTPSNTINALLNIAASPGGQTTALFNLAPAVAPFQPSLSTAPADFALAITFHAPSTVVQPSTVVIDASGNVWMANCQSCLNPTAPDSLLEFGPTGTFLHSYTGSVVLGTQVLHRIKGIAIDPTSNNIYTINQGIPGGPTGGIGDDQLIKMDLATGTLQGGFPIDFDQATYGVDNFNGIALDNSGKIWATAGNTGAIIQAAPDGNLINGSPFFIGGTLGVATDNSGNIWFAGIGSNNIIQFDTYGDVLNNLIPVGLNQPVNMAINGSSDLITINQASQSLSRVEPNGNNAPGSPYSNVGIFQATVTAIDGTSQIVIPNCRASCPSSGSTQPDNLLRFNQGGAPDTGGGVDGGALADGFSAPTGAAIDAAGNVWVSNNLTGTLTQVIGFASPTIQPLARASSNGTIGQLP